MNGRFRTTFDDGTTVENEAPNSTEAKLAAKTERYNQVDPSRSRFAVAADRERHPSIKVTKVEEIGAVT